MWPLLPVAPAALIGLGAAASLIPATRLSERARRAIALGTTLAALAVALVLARQSGAEAVILTYLPLWPGTVFAAGPAVGVDAAATWCLVLLGFGAFLAAARASASDASEKTLGRALVVAAASALMIATVRSPMGIALAWVCLDLTLFLAGGGSRHGLLAGQAGLAFALIGLASLPAGGFGAEASSAAGLAARPWLIAASAIRMGVFPIWWAVPSARRRHQWGSGLVRLGPTLAGICLAIEAARLGPPPTSIAGGVGMAVLAVGGSGVLAGLSIRYGRTLDWSLAHTAGLVLLAGSIGGVTGDAIALLLATEIAISRAGAYLVPRHEGDPVHRSARLILNAGMVGVPPLLGFAARWPLYRELLARGMVGALVVTSIGTAFALAGTLRTRPVGAREVLPADQTKQRSIRAIVILIVGLEIGLGVAIGLLAWNPFPGPGTLPVPILELATGLGSSAGRAGAVALLGLLLLPLALGGLLARILTRTVDRGRLAGLDLTPAVDAAAGGLLELGAILQKASGLVEGRRALAWTLLAAVAVGLAPLRPPGPGSGFGSASLFLILIASVVAGSVVLARRPWVELGGLAAAYVLSCGVLIWAGTPWIIAVIKLMTGAFVVAILTLGATQGSSGGDRAAAAARRLSELRPGSSTGGWGVVPPVAIACAAVLATGIHSVVAAGELPDIVLQCGIVLAAGGVVAVALARDPLRLATGALLAVTGFEMVYARLDPGLVVTGALAGFQLLLALVFSYFVGGSSSLEPAAPLGLSEPAGREQGPRP